PEYRERLMRKINCLIAVLEVASAKVKRSLNGPDPDLDRLVRIQTNLASTLEVCRRARRALERRETLPEGLPENLAAVVRQAGKLDSKPMPTGARQEMTSPLEMKRFQSMGAITPEAVRTTDMDELTRLLLE
ncbi:MAG TPA: hypothetical protein PLJ12_12125, partial [Planctomycetota bacterium]|nr:hypothetical protein [Planctomycetota bacterium]